MTPMPDIVGARFADYDEDEATRKAAALRPQAGASSNLVGDTVRGDAAATKTFVAPTKVATESGGDGRGRGRGRGGGADRGSGGGGPVTVSSEAERRAPAPCVGDASSAGATSDTGAGGDRGRGGGAAMGGGRGGGRGGKTVGGRGGGGLGSASLASSEGGTGRPPAPRVSTADADAAWDKLDTSQRTFFATWKPSAGGDGAHRARAR